MPTRIARSIWARMSNMRLLLGLVLLASLFITGCGEKLQQTGGLPQKPLVTVVSLSPSSTEVLARYIPTMNLVGRTSSCNFPAGGVLDKIPVVANVKPNYEQISQMKPDLIVLDASLYSKADLEKIKSLGSTVFAFDANSLDDFVDQLRRFAILSGSETEISEYADKIYHARGIAQAEPLNPKPKVAVLTGGMTADHMISGTKNFIADVVRASGGEAVGPDSTLFVSMNPEALVQLNPDVIFLGTSSAKGAAPDAEINALRNDPRLKTVKAIAAGKVYGVNSDILLRKGSRVDVLIDGMHRALAQGK